MPLYRYVKDASGMGNSRMVEVDIYEPSKTEFNEPMSVNVEGAEAPRLKCKICEKKFAKAGIFSIHYNKEHRKDPENKDEWRTAVENTGN